MKLLLSLLFLAIATYAEDSEFKKCLAVTSVPVPVKILENEQWNIILHSNCENCKNGSHSLGNLVGRSGQVTKCWNLQYEGKKGKGTAAPIKCTYSVIDEKFKGEGKCEMQTSKAPKLGGGHTIFDSDGETYIVGAFCVYGKENFWYIASIHDKMDSTKIHEIKKKIHHAGFSTDNIATKGIDDVVFTGYKLTNECSPV